MDPYVKPPIFKSASNQKNDFHVVSSSLMIDFHVDASYISAIPSAYVTGMASYKIVRNPTTLS
jgi:hypothetical protein